MNTLILFPRRLRGSKVEGFELVIIIAFLFLRFILLLIPSPLFRPIRRMCCWSEYNLIGKIRDFHSLYMGSIPFIHLWVASSTAFPAILLSYSIYRPCRAFFCLFFIFFFLFRGAPPMEYSPPRGVAARGSKNLGLILNDFFFGFYFSLYL